MKHDISASLPPSERVKPAPGPLEQLARDLYTAYAKGRVRRVAWRPSKRIRPFDELPLARRTGWIAVARAAVARGAA